MKFSSVIAIFMERFFNVTPVAFTGDQYEVSNGGMTSVVPVPADEFVISFMSSGSEIIIFLLADDDVITSDMIIIVLSSSQSYAGICQAYRESKASDYRTIELPGKQGKMSRNCFYATISDSNNVSTFQILSTVITNH